MSYPSLDDTVSVAPQITPDEVTRLAREGIRMIICNRPDDEVPADLGSDRIGAACEAAGIAFVANPFGPGGLRRETIDRQAQAMAAADGPVVAYCASGTRSAVLWAFAAVQSGTVAPDVAARALAEAGYSIPGLEGQLATVATG